jgi:hypothetical protein
VRTISRLTKLEATIKTWERTHFAERCICFPANEQPEFRWQAEVDLAEKVLCPLHGKRFQFVARHCFWQNPESYNRTFERGWPHSSPQYQKAMRASLDPDLWPAKWIELTWPEKPRILILKDGTQIESGGLAELQFQLHRNAKKIAKISRVPG